MKKLIIVLAWVLPIFACTTNGRFTTGAPSIPPNLCEEYAASKPDSVLLKIQAQYNIPLNEVYYGLVDTTGLILLTKNVSVNILIKWPSSIMLIIPSSHLIVWSLIWYQIKNGERRYLWPYPSWVLVLVILKLVYLSMIMITVCL